ncbi:hypothetical protein F5880DRAFT_1615648 [Lentinula raphanica]|nr:hypothetical protein F5880DRAFT_1615648 [Lentinula raphanica]
MSSHINATMPPAPTNTPLGSPPPYPADEDRSAQVVDDSGNALDLHSAVRNAVLGIVQDPRLMGSEFDPSRLPVNVLDGILSNVLAFNAELECVECLHRQEQDCIHTEHGDVRRALVASRLAYKHLHEEVEDNRRYINRLEDDFDATEMELVALRNEHDALVRKHDCIQQDRAAAQQEVDRLEDMCHDLEHQVIRLQTDNVRLVELKDLVWASNQNLQSQLQLEAVHSCPCGPSLEVIELFEHQQLALRSELDKIRSDLDLSRTSVHNLHMTTEFQEVTIAQQEEENSILRSTIETLEARLATVSSTNEVNLERFNVLTSRYNSLLFFFDLSFRCSYDLAAALLVYQNSDSLHFLHVLQEDLSILYRHTFEGDWSHVSDMHDYLQDSLGTLDMIASDAIHFHGQALSHTPMPHFRLQSSVDFAQNFVGSMGPSAWDMARGVSLPRLSPDLPLYLQQNPVVAGPSSTMVGQSSDTTLDPSSLDTSHVLSPDYVPYSPVIYPADDGEDLYDNDDLVYPN